MSSRAGGLMVPLSAVISGVCAYAFLVGAARVLDPTAYGILSVVWTVSVILSVGVLVPLEQESARSAAIRRPGEAQGALLRVACPTVLTVGVTASVIAVMIVVLSTGSVLLGILAGAIVALTVVQMLLRGVLSVSGGLTGYAAVLGAEGLIRFVGPLAVAIGLVARSVEAVTSFLLLAVALSVAAGLPWRVGRPLPLTTVTRAAFGRDLVRRVVVALAVQLALNGVVLVIALSPASADDAGRALAVVTLARIPTFAYQGVQALLLPRLTAAWEASRGFVLPASALALAAMLLAAVTLAVCLLAGPAIVNTLYGQGYVLPGPTTSLLAAGIVTAGAAVVIGDIALAAGGHAPSALVWVGALVVGAAALALSNGEMLTRGSIGVLAAALAALAGQLAVVGGLLLRRAR